MYKNKRVYFSLVVTLLLVLLPLSIENVFAEEFEDGVYSIDYTVIHAETESASIANDYFEKPSKLFVENGEKYIEFSINHSKWVKELQAPTKDGFQDVEEISEDSDDDIRVVRFKLEEDLNSLIELKMHVLIEEMEPVYDHKYTVRLNFDLNSVNLLPDEPGRVATKSNETSNQISTKSVIFFISVFLIIAIAIVTFMKRKK